jgi:predicted nucleotidyltransferase
MEYYITTFCYGSKYSPIKDIWCDRINQKCKNAEIVILPKNEFNFSKKDENTRSKKTDKIFFKFLDIVNKYKINYFLVSGSLLPLFRKESLAKYSDVDLRIENKNKKIFLKNIFKLKNVKITKRYIINNKKKILTQLIINSKKTNFYEEPAIIDICIYFKHKNKNKFYCYYGGEKKKILMKN